jgi:hypothetical protein
MISLLLFKNLGALRKMDGIKQLQATDAPKIFPVTG